VPTFGPSSRLAAAAECWARFRAIASLDGRYGRRHVVFDATLWSGGDRDRSRIVKRDKNDRSTYVA
jgi:hypothetical protein